MVYAGALGAVLIGAGLFFVTLYNRLVKARNDVKNAWSTINIQLKRRHDLIPNLIETVKGYVLHEREVLDSLVKARQAALGFSGDMEQRGSLENAVTQGLRSLFALAEAYPTLKANENFLALQEELTSTENKIGFARQYYNDAAMRYRNAIELFPSNLVAGVFGFQPEPFFEMEDAGERAAPRVGFQ